MAVKILEVGNYGLQKLGPLFIFCQYNCWQLEKTFDIPINTAANVIIFG